MTKKAYRKVLIQQVHLSVKYRAYYRENREDYQALLQREFGVDSSTHLSIENLIALVDFLNGRTERVMGVDEDKITTSQKEKLLEVWERYARDSSMESLMRFIYTVEGRRYMRIDVLSKRVASKVISILLKSLK